MFGLRHPRGWPADSFATERTGVDNRRPPVKVRISRVGFDGVTSPSATLFVPVRPFRSVPFRSVPIRSAPFRSAPFRSSRSSCLGVCAKWDAVYVFRIGFDKSFGRLPISSRAGLENVSRVFLSYADGCATAAINTGPGRNLAANALCPPQKCFFRVLRSDYTTSDNSVRSLAKVPSDARYSQRKQNFAT